MFWEDYSCFSLVDDDKDDGGDDDDGDKNGEDV